MGHIPWTTSVLLLLILLLLLIIATNRCCYYHCTLQNQAHSHPFASWCWFLQGGKCSVGAEQTQWRAPRDRSEVESAGQNHSVGVSISKARYDFLLATTLRKQELLLGKAYKLKDKMYKQADEILSIRKVYLLDDIYRIVIQMWQSKRWRVAGQARISLNCCTQGWMIFCKQIFIK